MGATIAMELIKIDRYEAVIEGKDVKYYAVSGKKRYPMPSAYADMYTDEYLAITERTLERPELYDTDKEHCEEKHYIPIRTVMA